MQRILIGAVSGLALAISIYWFFKEGGFEPAVTSLAGMAGLLSSFWLEGRPSSLPNNHNRGDSLSQAEDEILMDDPAKVGIEPQPASAQSGKLFKGRKNIAQAFADLLKKELDAIIRKVDETYYELYERGVRDPHLFQTHTPLAERWKLEVITKMAVVHIHALCDEQAKLQNTIGASKGFKPVWRVESDPQTLVKKVLFISHKLIQGDAEPFISYLESLGLKKSRVAKLIRFADQSAEELFRIDGQINAKRRKIMTDLIRLKASSDH